MTLFKGLGTRFLDGGPGGNDSLIGEAGNDTFVVNKEGVTC